MTVSSKAIGSFGDTVIKGDVSGLIDHKVDTCQLFPVLRSAATVWISSLTYTGIPMEANPEMDIVQRVALLESRVAALEQSVHPTSGREEGGGRREEPSSAAPPSSFLPPPSQERGEVGVVEEAWRSAPLPLRL